MCDSAEQHTPGKEKHSDLFSVRGKPGMPCDRDTLILRKGGCRLGIALADLVEEAYHKINNLQIWEMLCQGVHMGSA